MSYKTTSINRYYLYQCNQIHDIENNIQEIEIPEFTMAHIRIIDKKYKKQVCQLKKQLIQEHKHSREYNVDDEELKRRCEIFEINELFNEHLDIIEKIKIKMNEYNSIQYYIANNDYITFKKYKQEMYFQEIIPLIKNDEENLNDILSIISS